MLVVCAWPLALTEFPPYQDLPNHLASAAIVQRLDQYPEFVFNGLLKTNSALLAWLLIVGKVTGLSLAARLFALIVLGANALVLPRFVLVLTGSRERMIIASALMWPMIHNWFVSTGMLNFALAVPLALAVLMAIYRQRRAPNWTNGLAVTGLGVLTWYAHVFPLLVVHLLVGVEAMFCPSSKGRVADVRTMATPLLPVTALVGLSLLSQMGDTVGPMTGFADYRKLLPVWELAYNMWAEYLWGFSKLTITSLVPCLLLAGLGASKLKESPPFFSPIALAVMLGLYCLLPYTATNWFHLNSRLIPFLWAALALRVPRTLPRPVLTLLGISAALYSAGMGGDFVRLERERQEFTAGIPSVPEGARLLPLLFRQTGSSDNTRSLLHYWGYYVIEKHTTAPLLFAHSNSFPVMYRHPPPPRFNHLPLEGFARSSASSADVCKRIFEGNVTVNDCDAAFHIAWRSFWSDAIPTFDYLLIWDATQEARALIPPVYQPIFERGRLAIYARVSDSPAPR